MRLLIDADALLKYRDDHEMISTHLIWNAPTIEPRQQWIPCSERLPNIGEHHISEPCIVYCKNGVYAFAELEENIFGQVGWNCERDDDYHEPIGEVVAWMPLPEWEGVDDD